MTEISSSDGSDYYDFTPSKKTVEADVDEADLDWDEHEEQLSFVENNETGATVRSSTPGPSATQPTLPLAFGGPQPAFLSHWPPRRLSSEFTNQIIV